MSTRLGLIIWLIVSAFLTYNICVSHAQEAEMLDIPATIHGAVFEATPEQLPIEGVTVTIVNSATDAEYVVKTDENGEYEKTGLPAGRYSIAVSKDGYGDRVGKSMVVPAGGEIFFRIKMKKRETIITFIQQRFFTSQSLIGLAIVLFIVLILFSLRRRA